MRRLGRWLRAVLAEREQRLYDEWRQFHGLISETAIKHALARQKVHAQSPLANTVREYKLVPDEVKQRVRERLGLSVEEVIVERFRKLG